MSTLGDMLKYLPPRLAEAIAEECGRLGADDGAGAGQHCFVTELRLRRELPCSLTLSDGRNTPCRYRRGEANCLRCLRA